MSRARHLFTIFIVVIFANSLQAQALVGVVVKTKPLRYLSGPNHTLGVELVYNERFSLELLFHREYVWDYVYSDPEGFGNFKAGKGYGVYFAPRIFLKETAPKRWYVSIALGDLHYQIDRAWNFTGSGGSTVFNVDGNLKEALFLYGFQALLSGTITFDVSIGLGYGWSTEQHEYIDGSRNGFPNGFRSVSNGRTVGQSNISIGYYWSRK